jgi:hypothetical protein
LKCVSNATFEQIIQVPQGRYKVLPPERTKTGPYPVALIPGQFQDYYKRYGSLTKKLLFINEVLTSKDI